MRYSKSNKTAEIAKLPRAMLVGGAAAMVAVAAFLALTVPQPSTRKVLPAFSLPVPALLNSAVAPADEKPLRLVYRNSVVPGGVHSAAELAAVIKRDPIAAAHYADFKVAAAHLVPVEQSRMVHVSYRIGNQIFWTKNKVRLALGEALLSDGEHLIRARCGNRIADTIDGPVLENEPPPEVLETAFVSAGDLIDQTVSMAALGGMPPLPGPGDSTAATAAPVLLDTLAPLADRFGMPAMTGVPILPGVTVLGARAAPALVVDAVSTPIAAVPVPVTAPVSAPAPTTPAAPVAVPVPVSTPVASTPAAPVSTPAVTVPVSITPQPAPPLFPVLESLPTGDTPAPIDIKTELPTPAAPEAPFIEAPTFVPTPPLTAKPTADSPIPEPATIALTLLSLALLVAARRRRS